MPPWELEQMRPETRSRLDTHSRTDLNLVIDSASHLTLVLNEPFDTCVNRVLDMVMDPTPLIDALHAALGDRP